jgi:hypothetical protein
LQKRDQPKKPKKQTRRKQKEKERKRRSNGTEDVQDTKKEIKKTRAITQLGLAIAQLKENKIFWPSTGVVERNL